ncbi:SDR family oxidoreductase [Altererythrobacter salegens]|uniref:SDR family oxidoreductase n=1 Tax=Croceibacterium salegens TaxID=1737568 RepID=A0A6I4SZK2_9SPHN|nr:SDR family oxidoreductase [Croceibacterium salegens]MXO60670.1 SDR family oxidoreductase [Croceibacterium salegens]
MGRFTDRSYVVTGGSNGIGKATALRIAEEGGKVLVTGLNPERLAAVSNLHPNITGVRNNAREQAEADALAEKVKQQFGKIDGVFLNAGIGIPSPLGSITLDSFRETFELNVAGVLFGAQSLAPLMKSGSSMLLTCSGAKLKGTPEAALYAGSKGAIRSIALVLARALLAQGIRVNTISPGPIATDFHGGGALPAEQQAEMEAVLKKMIPLGRVGGVEEAVAVATFLLSPESSFVTGADYPVDGGEAQL